MGPCRPGPEPGLAHGGSAPFYFGCTTVWATYMNNIGLDGTNRSVTPGCRGCAPQKEAIMSIEQFIDNEVKSNDVVLFMKGSPQFPQCGFSGQVVQILDHVG